MHVERLFLDLLVDLDGVLFGNFAIWCIFSKKNGTFSSLDYCDEPCFFGATFLNIASNVLPAYSKILIALVLYYFVHRILYISNRFFGLYISIIIYATMCCIDNLWHTLALLLSETLNGVFLGNALCQSMLVHGVIIAVCFYRQRREMEIKSSNQFQMVHHSCSAFPCECFAYFLFWKLLSAGFKYQFSAMCLCHIYYCNADSSVNF